MAEGSRLESGQVSKPRGFESLRLRKQAVRAHHRSDRTISRHTMSQALVQPWFSLSVGGCVVGAALLALQCKGACRRDPPE